MSELNWYAVYVKSRHEFMVATELGRKGIEAYLPSVKKLRQWKDRKKLVEFPLFPGYLFIHVSPRPEEFVNALRTNGVVTLLSNVAGYPTPVPAAEIGSLRLLVEGGEELDIYPHIKKGAKVRIRKGPLAGAEGTLETKEGMHMFRVNIEILGRSVGVKIYADDVEAA